MSKKAVLMMLISARGTDEGLLAFASEVAIGLRGVIEPRISAWFTWFLEDASRLGPTAVVLGRQGYGSSVNVPRSPERLQSCR
jgi:hypothetical protein